MDENGKRTDDLKTANNAVKPDTTALQDLLAALGIKFWKTQKQKASNPDKNKEINELDTMQADKTRLTADFAHNSSHKNLENVKEQSEGSLVEGTIANDDTGKTTGIGEDENAKDGALSESTVKATTKRIFTHKIVMIPLIIALSFGAYSLYSFITEPKPPSEDVVASFSGKNLTKGDLLAYIQSRGYKEEQHGLCEKHGFDHNKCDKTEECETHPIDSLESYRQIIKMIAVQQIIDDWAKEKGITQKNQVKHDFKHLVEEVSLDKLVGKMHQEQLSPEKIDKWEIQKYYDANKDTYRDKPFNEVEGEIRSILAAEKDKKFLPEYIEKLKKNASLSVNYDLLRIEDPAQVELRKNEALFTIHGKPFTLGSFKEEFKELSPEIQTKFANFKAKKTLIDQFIAKELLLEEAGDDAADKEDNKEIEAMKSRYLSQMLHKEEIDEKIGQVSDEEVQKFYEEKKNVLVEPAKAQISLIRVAQGPSDAEKSRARQRIDEARQKLADGMDFAVVAREYSSDPTASAGGELKAWIYDSEHVAPVLRENIFKLQPDAISNVFEYKGEYYIVKLRQKEDKRQKTFDEVKELIKGHLLDEKHREKEAKLEDELLKKAQLVIYDSSLRSMLKEEKKMKL